jgi:hypothetical protein
MSKGGLMNFTNDVGFRPVGMDGAPVMNRVTLVFSAIIVLGAVSTLGQTFVIGLFMPKFLDRFDVSLQAFGTTYGIALAAARADRVHMDA